MNFEPVETVKIFNNPPDSKIKIGIKLFINYCNPTYEKVEIFVFTTGFGYFLL